MLESCEEVIRRFANSEDGGLLEYLAQALEEKKLALRDLDRQEEVLAVCDDIVSRFGESEVSWLQELVAKALLDKAHALRQLTRTEDALGVYDEVAQLCGSIRTRESLEFANVALWAKVPC